MLPFYLAGFFFSLLSQRFTSPIPNSTRNIDQNIHFCVKVYISRDGRRARGDTGYIKRAKVREKGDGRLETGDRRRKTGEREGRREPGEARREKEKGDGI